MAMENLSIAQHRDALRYAHTRGGSYKPKVKQFDVGDFVYLQRQPNDTLDTSSSRTILRIKAIRPSGSPWILPSSRRLGFLHLIIHVMYVRGRTMLIKCCFATTVMVDTIFSASSRSSLKFLLAIGTIHHVLLQHLDSYLDHAMLF
jgi:hypothetical protein